MGASNSWVTMVTLTMLVPCTASLADERASAIAPAASAPTPASAPARTAARRAYQAPIQVPSAAGQIRSPTLPAPAITVTPVPPRTFSGTCDSTGCWGSDAIRYNAVGGALVRPDGRTCQNVGGVMQCP